MTYKLINLTLKVNISSVCVDISNVFSRFSYISAYANIIPYRYTECTVLRKCSRKIRYVNRSLLTVKLNHSVYADKYIPMCTKNYCRSTQYVEEKGEKKREKAVSKPARNKIPILRDS